MERTRHAIRFMIMQHEAYIYESHQHTLLARCDVNRIARKRPPQDPLDFDIWFTWFHQLDTLPYVYLAHSIKTLISYYNLSYFSTEKKKEEPSIAIVG